MTHRCIHGALALAFLLAPGTGSRGAEPRELSRLFPREAEVVVEQEGLSRLVLPPRVLAACRPDLSDLRLFDRRGRELPFLVDAGRPVAEGIRIARSYDPPVLEAARNEIRRESGPPLRRESYDLLMPDELSTSGPWTLVVETGRGDFVARARIESVGEDGEISSVLYDGSLYRMRGVRRSEKLRVPLPSFEQTRLRAILESEHRFWLEPGFRLETSREIEGGGRIAVPLEVVSTRSGRGRTRIELARPTGIVPDLLRIETATRTFDRAVEVWDEGPRSVPDRLGNGRIFRVDAVVPVAEQELTLDPARGDRLRVEISDGDSPPLESPAFSAVVRQPALIFSVDADRPGESAATLRFGGGRAHRPRYDLSALLPARGQTVTGKRAEAAALLYDPAVVRPARLGGIRENPAYDGAPALAFAMHAGSRIDRRAFRHVRPLVVPAAPEGLSRLTLDAADLAVLREDLGDLRVADDESRQWPFLLEPAAEPGDVRLRIEGPDRSDDGRSIYRLHPPVAPLRPIRIVLDTDLEYFDRAFRLEETSAGGERTALAAGRLVRPVGDPREVGIDLPGTRVESLTLIVQDGDDAPLAIRSAQARVLLPRLYLTAPEGRYHLLLGSPDLAAPRYELERVRDVVLAVQAAPIATEPLAANPDHGPMARLAGRESLQSILLWAVLIVAVLVLTTMTLRLARR